MGLWWDNKCVMRQNLTDQTKVHTPCNQEIGPHKARRKKDCYFHYGHKAELLCKHSFHVKGNHVAASRYTSSCRAVVMVSAGLCSFPLRIFHAWRHLVAVPYSYFVPNSLKVLLCEGDRWPLYIDYIVTNDSSSSPFLVPPPYVALTLFTVLSNKDHFFLWFTFQYATVLGIL
jgi:hypothetical protein